MTTGSPGNRGLPPATVSSRWILGTRRKVLSLLGTSAALTFVVAASPQMLFRRREARRVSLRLNYVPNAEHAPYYLGIKKRIYAREAIQLEVESGTGSVDTAKLVGTGHSDFGVAVADAIVVGRGRDLPVKSLAVLLQQNPNVVASLAAKGIKRPKDLYGKRVGTNARSTTYAVWLAFAKATNLDLSRMEAIELGASNAPGLMASGTIDACLLLSTNEKVALEAEGYRLGCMEPADYGVRSYGQVLFTSESTIHEDAGLVARMARATVSAWNYSLEHPNEAILALKEAAPEIDVAQELAKWREIAPRTKARDGDDHIAFGEQSVKGWQQTYDTFRAAELIARPYDPGIIIYATR
jgi:NitT/TauT family transport system substrate-binding protein